MPIQYEIVWNELKNIVFTCFQRRNVTPQKCLGQSSKYPKLMPKIIKKMVPEGALTVPFLGCLARLGRVSALGSILVPFPHPSPESLLAASWGCWGTFLATKLLKAHPKTRLGKRKLTPRVRKTGGPLNAPRGR